jgi:hypothetical protein
MFFSFVIVCEQRPAPAPFWGHLLCFIRLLLFASSGPRPLHFGAIAMFRLDPSLSHSRRVASKDEQHHETDGPFVGYRLPNEKRRLGCT